MERACYDPNLNSALKVVGKTFNIGYVCCRFIVVVVVQRSTLSQMQYMDLFLALNSEALMQT